MSQKRKERTDDDSSQPGTSTNAPSTPVEQPEGERATKKPRLVSDEERAWRKKYGKMTLEQARDLQVATWKGPAYAHFRLPPEINLDDPDIPAYEFICISFPSNSVKRAVWITSTSNLLRHIRRCTGAEPPAGQASLKAFAHGSTYTPGRFRLEAVNWVTTCKRPFAIIEDLPLQRMFKMLNSNVKIHSQVTMSRDVQRVFKLSQEAVKKFLVNLPGRIHIAFDGWSSPNVMSTLGIKIIYVHEAKIRVLTLDLLRLVRAHNGDYLAEVTLQCLQDYGILDKLLGQACDNASNNDTMLAALESQLPQAMLGSGDTRPALAGVRTRIRCFAHIINLVVKAFLTQFDRPKKKKKSKSNQSDEDDELSDNEDDLAYDTLAQLDDVEDNELDEEERDALEEVDEERDAADAAEIEDISSSLIEVKNLTLTETETGRTAVTKLKLLGRRMRNNASMQEELARKCATAKIPAQKMVRAVTPRWNTVGDVVARGCELRPALDLVVLVPKFKAKLGKLRLSGDEWKILLEIQPILKAFKQTTARVEKSAVPLIFEVIPLIDMLTELMEKQIADRKVHATVRAAAARAFAILNKYYSKTDESVMYRIGMVLNPRYKKSYFVHKRWPQEWIDTAITLTREIWDSYYKPTIHQSSSPASQDNTSSGDSLFADIDNFNAAPQDADALDTYLTSAPENGITDPITYWSARLDKSGQPITANGALARMGLDFLSAPASSADVERDFSVGGLTVSKRRHNLGFESLRDIMVLNSWFKEGLVPESECSEYLNKLAKRPKNGGKGASGKEKSDEEDSEGEVEIVE